MMMLVSSYCKTVEDLNVFSGNFIITSNKFYDFYVCGRSFIPGGKMRNSRAPPQWFRLKSIQYERLEKINNSLNQ